ncbi:PAS domain S-box protein [Salinibacter ruber]|uniref:PAS domain S-box protein n=1 Tax=Salinibacter ruber TaxID=146919 RepID=UPI002342D816|nr:PAS domain S-box protein [Salinibacter ruber]MCS4136441.1 PAS domain S-box-containing protein [Salinibacter ruber]
MDALPTGDLGYLAYLLVFAVAAAGCLAGAWRAHRQVSLPGVRLGLTGLLSTSGLWSLCHVGVLLSPGLGLKVAFYEAGLTVGFGTVFAWLWLCSSYSGRALHRRAGVRWAALGIFAAVTLAKLTNRWHGLYFTAEMSTGPFPHLAVDHHVIYWLTSGLSYALAGVGFCMLAEPLRRAQVGGGKLAGLFALTALPLGANAVGQATHYLLNLNHEPVGVAAFALGALFVYRERFEGTSQAGIQAKPALMLSGDGRLRNYNRAAAKLFPALRGGASQEETPQEETPRKGATRRRLEEALPRLARALDGGGLGEKVTVKEPEKRRGLKENGRRSGKKPPEEDGMLQVTAGGGETRYYRPVESQAGPGAGRLVVLQDVTERVLRRRERASRLEAISDSMPGLAFEFWAGPGGERSIGFIGEEAGSFLGLSAGLEEAFKRFTEHVPESHREEFFQSVDSAVEGRSPWRHEFPFERPDGERVWLLGSAEPNSESSPEGEEVVFWGTLADITGRKRREQELRESRQELRREKRRAESITENVSEGIYRSTEEEGIVYANSAFIEMFGYRDLQELREAGPEALYVDPGRREELIEKEHRDGRLHQEEVRYRRKDGTVFVGLLSSQQVEEEEEGKTYFDGAITDITERKEERRRRKQTVQRVTDAIVEVDSEWRFTLVNDRAEEFYEKAEDNLLGKNFWDVFSQFEGTRLEEVYREVMQSREPTAIEEQYSGTGEWFEVQVYPNEDGGLAFYFEVVTERKKREEALRERQEKLESLYEATNHLLQAEGPEDLSARLSSLIRQSLGYPATTIRLARGGKLVPAHVPDVVQERMPGRPSYDIGGDTPAAEAHRSGETRAFEDLSAEFEAMDRGDVRATAYVPMGRYGLISVGSFEAGGIGPFDLRLVEVLGSYAALVLERLKREEELLTAKKEAEQARKESEEARQEAEEAKEEAEEASRLKSALLANMSHEIRTPLTSIIGFAEMLGREASGLELSEESPLPGYASTIEQSGKRLLETLNGVLNLSKLQAGQMEMEAGPIDLPEQARLAAGELRPDAEEKGIELELETGGGPAVLAEADEGGVQIVIRNLLANAIKYTDEGGVTVRTYREDGDSQEDGQAEKSDQVRKDSWAVLEVEDTGIGMDPEVAEGLFEPFRQASEGLSREYEGTGIGLAVTREAVAQMGGSIEVDTQKGEGTCMTVRLPGAEGGIPTGD